MCGIAGLLDPDWSGHQLELEALAQSMAEGVAHRGPDDNGTWADPTTGIALGHRRLAIVDLSPAGHQPMVSADGRWVITYNGECYNAPEIRAALPGGTSRLRGHCDTELVVEAVAAWGLGPALERLDAMFAMALWDRRDRVLHLVRDRLGEKPLYYSVHGRRVTFGSELRALQRHPAFVAEIDRQSVGLLMRLNYIPAPATIYRSVRKLEAGTMVSITAGRSGWPDPSVWWDFREVARASVARRPPIEQAPQRETVEQLEAILTDSVSRRLIADVPVGTFLSGGIDSSLVAALARRASNGPVRTFTVGFGGEGEDETEHAASVARHLGTDHTEVDLSPDDALRLVPGLHDFYDEPFADPSQLPTLLLCREARDQVTVALTGDGGDEIFGGYRRYTAGGRVATWLGRFPRPVRQAGAALLEAVPASWWDAGGPALGARVHKMANLMAVASTRDVYMSLISGWDGAEPVLGYSSADWAGPPALTWDAQPVDSMMAWDTLATLPDEMLVKVDRASMAFALEVRPPLLSHHLVEAAWELPPNLRVDGGTGKWVLREILEKYVPRQLTERPKTGFDPPLAQWLRGPLREWAGDLLETRRLQDQGLLDPTVVQARWQDLLQGKAGREYGLWSALVLQSWLDGVGGG